MDNAELAAELRKLAEDLDMLWEVPRRAIEDVLVDYRDSGIMMPLRNNGLVINNKDTSHSGIIRLGPEGAIRIGLMAIAEHIENKESNDEVV